MAFYITPRKVKIEYLVTHTLVHFTFFSESYDSLKARQYMTQLATVCMHLNVHCNSKFYSPVTRCIKGVEKGI